MASFNSKIGQFMINYHQLCTCQKHLGQQFHVLETLCLITLSLIVHQGGQNGFQEAFSLDLMWKKKKWKKKKIPAHLGSFFVSTFEGEDNRLVSCARTAPRPTFHRRQTSPSAWSWFFRYLFIHLFIYFFTGVERAVVGTAEKGRYKIRVFCWLQQLTSLYHRLLEDSDDRYSTEENKYVISVIGGRYSLFLSLIHIWRCRR